MERSITPLKRRLAMRLSKKEFKKKLEKQREKVNQKKFGEVLHELDRPVFSVNRWVFDPKYGAFRLRKEKNDNSRKII